MCVASFTHGRGLPRPYSPPLQAAYQATLESPSVAATNNVRIERDSMGEIEVPADAYYGASTQRAVINFPISGQRFPRRFIQALGLVKRAAAEVNHELGLLDRKTAGAVVRAAEEVADGKL